MVEKEQDIKRLTVEEFNKYYNNSFKEYDSIRTIIVNESEIEAKVETPKVSKTLIK